MATPSVDGKLGAGFRLNSEVGRKTTWNLYQRHYCRRLDESEYFKCDADGIGDLATAMGAIATESIVTYWSAFGVAVAFLTIWLPWPWALLGLTAEGLGFAVTLTRARQMTLIDRYLKLLRLVELSPARWNSMFFRGKVNRRIESVARAIEVLPQQLSPSDGVSRLWAFSRAAASAAALRQLKSLRFRLTS